MMGEALQATIRKYFDNSLDNIGRGNSVSPLSVHSYPGKYQTRALIRSTAGSLLIWDLDGLRLLRRHPGCIRVSRDGCFFPISPPLCGSLAHIIHLTLPSDCFTSESTAWSTEGGIRCPAIVRHPSIPGEKRGGVEHAFTTVMDILPTVVSPHLPARPPNKYKRTDVMPLIPLRSGNSWIWPGFCIQERCSVTVPSCHSRGRAGRAGYPGLRGMYTMRTLCTAGNVSPGSLASKHMYPARLIINDRITSMFINL